MRSCGRYLGSRQAGEVLPKKPLCTGRPRGLESDRSSVGTRRHAATLTGRSVRVERVVPLRAGPAAPHHRSEAPCQGSRCAPRGARATGEGAARVGSEAARGRQGTRTPRGPAVRLPEPSEARRVARRPPADGRRPPGAREVRRRRGPARRTLRGRSRAAARPGGGAPDRRRRRRAESRAEGGVAAVGPRRGVPRPGANQDEGALRDGRPGAGGAEDGQGAGTQAAAPGEAQGGGGRAEEGRGRAQHALARPQPLPPRRHARVRAHARGARRLGPGAARAAVAPRAPEARGQVRAHRKQRGQEGIQGRRRREDARQVGEGVQGWRADRPRRRRARSCASEGAFAGDQEAHRECAFARARARSTLSTSRLGRRRRSSTCSPPSPQR
jgi:hypothetical protein